MSPPLFFFFFFFFNDTATTEIYTLSLHDALPISAKRAAVQINNSRQLADGRRACVRDAAQKPKHGDFQARGHKRLIVDLGHGERRLSQAGAKTWFMFHIKGIYPHSAKVKYWSVTSPLRSAFRSPQWSATIATAIPRATSFCPCWAMASRQAIPCDHVAIKCRAQFCRPTLRIEVDPAQPVT